MSAATIAARLMAAATRAGRRAVAERRRTVIAAVPADISASAGEEGVLVAAPGLRARAFGTRRAPRDVRLLATWR